MVARAQAAFVVQYTGLYHTYSDDQSNLEYSRMHNGVFAAASVGRSNKFYLGPSYHMTSKTHKAAEGETEKEVSFTEFGATFLYYFDDDRRWKVEATYNLSVKGERSDGSTTADLDGSGYRLNAGYQLPVNKNFAIGASITYQAINISSNVVDNVETEETESYTTITPMLELSFRFF